MGPKRVKEALRTLYNAKQPAYLWGAPGIGKTSVTGQTAAEIGIDFWPLRLMSHDITDFKIPVIDPVAGTVKFVQSLLPTDPAWNGIILLDDFANCNNLMQSVLLGLLDDSRSLGRGYTLPDGAMIVLASNRLEDRAGVNRLMSSLNRRLVHLDYDVSNEEWREWAVRSGVRFEVREFVAPQPGSSSLARPKLLHYFKPELNERAYPCPAAWASVSKICDAIGLQEMKTAADVSDQSDKLSDLLFYELVAGKVGTGPAAEFIAHLRLMFQLPDPAKILDNPKTAKVPTEPSILWALCGALVDNVRNNGKDKSHLSAFVTYIGRMPGEFATLAMRDAAAVRREVLMTNEGADWLRANKALLL